MKVLTEHTWVTRGKWNWDEILDGQIRQYDKEDLGDTKPTSFVLSARSAAKKRERTVKTQTTKEGSVVIQALDKDGKPLPAKRKGTSGTTSATSRHGQE